MRKVSRKTSAIVSARLYNKKEGIKQWKRHWQVNKIELSLNPRFARINR